MVGGTTQDRPFQGARSHARIEIFTVAGGAPLFKLIPRAEFDFLNTPKN